MTFCSSERYYNIGQKTLKMTVIDTLKCTFQRIQVHQTTSAVIFGIGRMPTMAWFRTVKYSSSQLLLSIVRYTLQQITLKKNNFNAVGKNMNFAVHVAPGLFDLANISILFQFLYEAKLNVLWESIVFN